MRKIIALAAVALGSATAAVPLASAHLRADRAPAAIVLPLEGVPAEPGVGRCTSDGICTFTDGEGTTVPATSRLSIR